ncbi:MAG: hypothetical protein ACOC3C_07840 [Candidatus Thorarchaeota archaeon]
MQSETSEHESQKEKRNRYMVLLTTLIVALFSPAIAILYNSPYYSYVQIMAMTWVWYGSAFGPPMPIPLMFILISSLPFTFMRLVFVYMVNRYYLRKTTRQKTLIAGIIAEAQAPMIYSLPYIIMFILSPGSPYFPMYAIPVPALIIVAFLLMRFRPPPERKSWVDNGDKGNWWSDEEAQSSPGKTPQQSAVDTNLVEESENEEMPEKETEEGQSPDEWLEESW